MGTVRVGADVGAGKMTMPHANADQERFWDPDAGPVRVRNVHAMDACLAPVLDLILRKAALTSGEDVLDIGCGGGTSTFAAATAVGSQGTALGADISNTLLAYAGARGDMGKTRFVHADAETYAFAPSSVDVMISRFGVKFFDNSAAAFANMARALRPGGRMVFAAWGAIPANPFFILPAGVAKSYLGPTPKSDPDAAGPFAFRDTARVVEILATAGLRNIEVDVEQIMLTPQGGSDGFAEIAMQIGPAHGALAHYKASNAQHDVLRARISQAAEAYITGSALRLLAEINLFSASKA
jgi:SAM-dependent methyltransferase